MLPELIFEADKNILKLDGIPVSLHCHHFNCGLIKAIEQIDYIRGIDIYVKEAAKCFERYFKRIWKDRNLDDSEMLDSAELLYRFMGYGRIDLSALSQGEGIVTSDSSYFVVGWFAHYGKRDTPVCHLTRGFLKGMLAALFERDIDDFNVKEMQCMITGAESCVFEVLRSWGDEDDAD